MSPSSSTSAWVSPDAGSSRSSSVGWAAIALASSIRLSVPYGRPAAKRKACWARPSEPRMSIASWVSRRSSRRTPMRNGAVAKFTLLRLCAPTITFSSTVRRGNSARF